MPLHTALCPTVMQYSKKARKDAFTGHSYIKICSDEPSALLAWMAGYGAKNFSKLCSKCKPNISRDGLNNSPSSVLWALEPSPH